MRTNKKRKGFTLVELLVVIAILAILATVSVVGYIGFTSKANQSADEQAVTQINTILEANEKTDGKNQNLNDVIAELNENNLEILDYKPLVKNSYFYWDASINRIIIANENDEVIYPEKYAKDTNVKYEMGRWSTLSGTIPASNAWESESTKTNGVYTNVNISDGKELYSFMKDYGDKKITTNAETTIKLDTEEIDLMGASWYLPTATAGTIIGNDATGTVIKNMYSRQSANIQNIPAYSTSSTNYFKGFIGSIPAGTSLTISNVTFDGIDITNPDDPYGNDRINGVICGSVLGTLTLNNVKVTNCSVRGFQKVGGFVGFVNGGTLNMNNCSISNTSIVTTSCEAGRIAGVVNTAGKINITGLSIDDTTTVSFDTAAIDTSTIATVKTYNNQTVIGTQTLKDKDGNITSVTDYSCVLSGQYSCYTMSTDPAAAYKYMIMKGISQYYFKGDATNIILTIDGEKYLLNGVYAVDNLNNINANMPVKVE